MSNDQPPYGAPPPPDGQQWPTYGGQSPYGEQPPYGGVPPHGGGQPPYGWGGGPYGPYGTPQQSPMAIASLVTGILGLPCCSFFVLSVVAIVKRTRFWYENAERGVNR